MSLFKVNPKCPECSSTNSIPIIYGLPSVELATEENKGKLWLGGCCITGDDPKWRCSKCGHHFGKEKWKHGNSV